VVLTPGSKETPTDERTRRQRDDYYPRYSTWSRSERESERTYAKHSRSRSRSHESSKKRHRGLTSTSHSRSSHVDEEEEAIKKKLERKLREKEESYQERLRKWESRERKKHQEYEREKDREKKKQEDLQEEAQNLRDFFEDYDDDVEDPKYYKGSNLQRRLADREVEEAADERDRQKEIEQLEIARRKVIEERDPNAESIILQMEQKMQEHRRKCLNLNENGSSGARYVAHNRQSPQNNSATNENSCEESPRTGFVEAIEENGHSNSHAAEPMDMHHSPNRMRSLDENVEMTPNEDGKEGGMQRKDSNTFLFSMSKPADSKARPAAAFDDDEPEHKAQKRSLSWLPPSANAANPQPLPPPPPEQPVSQLSIAEKKEVIKQIIERIPTSKDDLFAYPIDWKVVDLDFVNTRIKPWVDKKIMAYIGESEPTLSNFICEQVLEHNPPAKILNEIAMVLEQEAEVFVVKMWRLLIYVIAEKNVGLCV